MIWEQGHELQSRKYTIREKLGEGAYGVTYKADYKKLNEDFVIKVPTLETINRLNSLNNSIQSKYILHLKNEAILLAELEYHRHIVRIIDAFEENFQGNKIPVIVMNFIKGENLDKIIKSGKKIPEDKAVKYIYQIGTAIVFLRRHGLVHGDVHLGNIMITDNDEAVLIDFGLAKKIRNFISNEQKEGQYDYTDDIFDLATCLLEIVTGDREISEPLKKAIQKGRESKPSDRPQSMSEWLNMLPGIESYPRLGGGIKLPIPAMSVLLTDSQELQRLIQKAKWHGADMETLERICQVIGEYQIGGFSPTEDLIKFMYEHLYNFNIISKIKEIPFFVHPATRKKIEKEDS